MPQLSANRALLPAVLSLTLAAGAAGAGSWQEIESSGPGFKAISYEADTPNENEYFYLDHTDFREIDTGSGLTIGKFVSFELVLDAGEGKTVDGMTGVWLATAEGRPLVDLYATVKRPPDSRAMSSCGVRDLRDFARPGQDPVPEQCGHECYATAGDVADYRNPKVCTPGTNRFMRVYVQGYISQPRFALGGGGWGPALDKAGFLYIGMRGGGFNAIRLDIDDQFRQAMWGY